MSSNPQSKYTPLTSHTTTYKTIHSHPLSVHILIPNAPTTSPRPILVKFHGGFLITGTAAYEDWFPQWLIDYALQHNAVIVLPNHRLLPEANGVEIQEDIRDFWTWLAQTLPSYAHEFGAEVDLHHVLVAGESAGGYLSVQSALAWTGAMPPNVAVKACIATYPILDVSAKFYTESYEKGIFGGKNLPATILATHLADIEADAKSGNRRVVSDVTPPARLPLALSIVQQGKYLEFLGEERSLNPMVRLEDVKAQDVPPVLIIHGRDDSAVPTEGSHKFVEKAREALGEGRVELVVRPGEHGFDTDASVRLETDWLRDALGRITEAWLGAR
jgi:acetyl esterase/lipase